MSDAPSSSLHGSSDPLEGRTILLQGALKKRKNKSWTWKERWFVLDTACLHYYNSKIDVQPIGRIPLTNILSVKVLGVSRILGMGSSNQNKCFTLEVRGDFIILMADTETDAAKWMETIGKAIGDISSWTKSLETQEQLPKSTSEHSKIEGILTKRTKSSWIWHERYFVLGNIRIDYFRDSRKAELLGSIPLDQSFLLRENPHNFPGVDETNIERCFALVSFSKTTCFMAESRELKSKWVHAISLTLKDIQEHIKKMDPKASSQTESLSAQSNEDPDPRNVQRRVSSLDITGLNRLRSYSAYSARDSDQSNRRRTLSSTRNTPSTTQQSHSGSRRSSNVTSMHTVSHSGNYQMKKGIFGSIWKEKWVSINADGLQIRGKSSFKREKKIPMEEIHEIKLLETTDLDDFPDVSTEELSLMCIVITTVYSFLLKAMDETRIQDFVNIWKYLALMSNLDIQSIQSEATVETETGLEMNPAEGHGHNLFDSSALDNQDYPTETAESPQRVLDTLFEESEFEDALAETIGSHAELSVEPPSSAETVVPPSSIISEDKPQVPQKDFVTLIEGQLRKRAASSWRFVNRIFSLRVFYSREGKLTKRLFYFEDHQYRGGIDIDTRVIIKELPETMREGDFYYYCFSLEFDGKYTILQATSDADRSLWLQALKLPCTPDLFADIGLNPVISIEAAPNRHSSMKSDSSGGSSKSAGKAKFMNSLTKVMIIPFMGSKSRIQTDRLETVDGSLEGIVMYRKVLVANSVPWKKAFLSLQTNNILFFESNVNQEPFKIISLRKFSKIESVTESDFIPPSQLTRTVLLEADSRLLYITFEESVREKWIDGIRDVAKSLPINTFISTPKTLASFDSLLRGEVDDLNLSQTSLSVRESDARILASFLPSIVIKRFFINSQPLQEAEIEIIQAAVLFADISGFTPLSEKLCKRGIEGSEKLSTYLNKYFENLIAVIRFFGGDIIKFAGDAVLAMWANGPLWLNTLQAIQCAVEMQQKLNAWKAGDDGEMNLHVGIGCGRVSALHLGGFENQWEFCIMGSPLAQISIAESSAKTGEVAISKEAWQLAKGHCVGTAIGNTGCYKIERIVNAVPPRMAQTQMVTDEMVPLLRSYLQPVVNDRLTSGQASWLAELRRVTVMFLNLPILELDGADRASFHLLQEIALEMQKTIRHWAGTIRQFMADDKGTVMVVAFGLPPYSYENDAARCVMAALELQLNLKKKLGLSSTVGITTGSVFCGAVGSNDRREYAVVGDVVNLSARLMMAARKTLEANGITSDVNNTLCDRPTYEACRNVNVKQMRLRFKSIPSIRVKGKSEPIMIYYPVNTLEASKSSLHHTVRPVGRTHEWNTLKDNIDKLVNLKESSVSIIEGDAGMGKSILLGELMKEVVHSDVRSFFGSGDRIERSTPLSPWRLVISDYIGFDSYDHSGESQKQFLLDYLRNIDQLFPPIPDAEVFSSHSLESLAPLLTCILPKLQLADNSVTEEIVGDVRIDTVIDMLLRILLANSKDSTLIAIDNAQWFDNASWVLAKEIATKVENVMLVISMRALPAPWPPRFAEFMSHPGNCILKLKPLTHEESINFVCTTYMISEIPAPVAQLVVTKGQGNPFFIEEIMYRLFLTKALQIIGDVCTITSGVDIGSIPFPDSLQGITRSRVDNLPTGPQLTLKVASVVGAQFSVRIIKKIHPISASKIDVEKDLKLLEQMDFIACQPSLSGENDEDRVYAFRHLITEEVAYNLLLVEQRRKLHEAIGIYYEREESGNKSLSYERLAHHFTKAEVFDKAVKYLELASSDALQSNNTKEAIYFLKKAIAICDSQKIQIMSVIKSKLLASLAESYYRMGDMKNSVSSFEQALTLLALPIPQGRSSLSTLSSVVDPQYIAELVKGSPEEKLLTSRRSMRALSIISKPNTYTIYERLAIIYLLTNDRAKLIDAVVFSSQQITSESSDEERFLFLAMLTHITRVFGLHVIANRHSVSALQATPLCKMETSSYIYMALAHSGLCHGGPESHWEQCLSYIETALSLFELYGSRREWREGLYLKATYFLQMGEFNQMKMIGSTLVEVGRQNDDLQAVWWGLSTQIWGHLYLDEAETAMRLITEAKNIIDHEDFVDPFTRLELYTMLSMTRLKRGYHYSHVSVETLEFIMHDIHPERPPTILCAYSTFSAMADIILTVLRQLLYKPPDCSVHEIVFEGPVSIPTIKEQELLPHSPVPLPPSSGSRRSPNISVAIASSPFFRISTPTGSLANIASGNAAIPQTPTQKEAAGGFFSTLFTPSSQNIMTTPQNPSSSSVVPSSPRPIPTPLSTPRSKFQDTPSSFASSIDPALINPTSQFSMAAFSSKSQSPASGTSGTPGTPGSDTQTRVKTKSFSASSPPTIVTANHSPRGATIAIKEKTRKGSDATTSVDRSQRTVASERKKLEKLLKAVLEHLSRMAHIYPVLKPVELFWLGRHELYSGAAKQSVKSWVKALDRAEKLHLPWEQMQIYHSLAQHALDEHDRAVFRKKAIAIISERKWRPSKMNESADSKDVGDRSEQKENDVDEIDERDSQSESSESEVEVITNFDNIPVFNSQD